jgi:hypothetical protein
MFLEADAEGEADADFLGDNKGGDPVVGSPPLGFRFPLSVFRL